MTDHDEVFDDDDAPQPARAAETDKTARTVLEQRQRAYASVFGGERPSPRDQEIVMNDLIRFCRFAESTGHPNPHVAARLDGRREVFLRILDFTRLSGDALYLKYHQGDR